MTLLATLQHSCLWLSRPASSLMRNLVAYWRLDEESGTALDATNRGNTLTDNNTVQSAAGQTSRFARLFTPVDDDYFSLADNVDVSMGDIDFTLAVWLYLTTKTGLPFDQAWAIAKFTWSTPNREYRLSYDAGATDRMSFGVDGDGTDTGQGKSVTANSFGAPALDTWYCVISWHDATANTINIQVNNGIVDSAAHTFGVFNGTASFLIGSVAGDVTRNWAGRIANVGLWKRLLTADERALYYNGGSGLTFTANGFVPGIGWGGRS